MMEWLCWSKRLAQVARFFCSVQVFPASTAISSDALLCFSAGRGLRLTHARVNYSFAMSHETDGAAVAHCTFITPCMSRRKHERVPPSNYRAPCCHCTLYDSIVSHIGPCGFDDSKMNDSLTNAHTQARKHKHAHRRVLPTCLRVIEATVGLPTNVL